MVNLKEISEQLDREYEETRAAIDSLGDEVVALTRDNDDEGGAPRNHMGDEGTNDYERERLASVQGELAVRLQMIQDAQHRVADGTYGICQRCGNPIPDARLDAMPFAAYDIDCQEIIDAEAEPSGA